MIQTRNQVKELKLKLIKKGKIGGQGQGGGGYNPLDGNASLTDSQMGYASLGAESSALLSVNLSRQPPVHVTPKLAREMRKKLKEVKINFR